MRAALPFSTACPSASTASVPVTLRRRRRSASTTAKSDLGSPSGHGSLSAAHCLDRLGSVLSPDGLVAGDDRSFFESSHHHAAVGTYPARGRRPRRRVRLAGTALVGADRPDRPVQHGPVP